MELKELSPLFIFEIANNHNGSVNKAKKLISTFAEMVGNNDTFNFAFKLQYRNVDTCIHKSYRSADIPIIKRYIDTALIWDEYYEIKKAIDETGFISICTPFDEESVDKIVEHGYDIIKIPSCYFREWILLEKIATTNLPIIASTGGWELSDIDNVVSFFEHRDKDFALMHCVGEYPAKKLGLNFIDVLKKRYPHIPIGFSNHSSRYDWRAIGYAIAKGIDIYERHIGFEEDNEYSATPFNIRHELHEAMIAFEFYCNNRNITEEEEKSLKRLYRGVYAKEDILEGEKLTPQKIYLAMPSLEGQLSGHEISKYTEYYAQKFISKDNPVWVYDLKRIDKYEQIRKIVNKVSSLIRESGVIVPRQVEMEINYHYGLDKFYDYGYTSITIVNRSYCKKLIILLPGQIMPSHYHKIKDETFYVLNGTAVITLDGEDKLYSKGKMIEISPNTVHSLYSEDGAVIEEISTKHDKEDSYYLYDVQDNRKMQIRYRFE